nr:hypothetical protein GCM10020063_065000 [Dactylosporangium thailandense]
MAGTDGRVAQRRRTRKAIVDAAARLLADGGEPSAADIAAAAEVSRRTVYLHFPTLDQLLIDATVGAMRVDVDAALDAVPEDDLEARVLALVDAMFADMETVLPLGRRLVRLTVDAPPDDGEPRRGYRRVQWIERAVGPARERLGPERFERLVSMLAIVIGWEAFIVLFDVRGLTVAEARETCRAAAVAIVRAQDA